jgi:hypothetical protein
MHRQHRQHSNNVLVIKVIAVLMYSAVMWYACTSAKRWLGPCIDGPKHQWEQRMLEIDK